MGTSTSSGSSKLRRRLLLTLRANRQGRTAITAVATGARATVPRSAALGTSTTGGACATSASPRRSRASTRASGVINLGTELKTVVGAVTGTITTWSTSSDTSVGNELGWWSADYKVSF